MRTCIGITKSKKWFCRRPTGGKLFCDKHRSQPFWWFAGALFAILLSFAGNWLYGLTRATGHGPSGLPPHGSNIISTSDQNSPSIVILGNGNLIGGARYDFDTSNSSEYWKGEQRARPDTGFETELKQIKNELYELRQELVEAGIDRIKKLEAEGHRSDARDALELARENGDKTKLIEVLKGERDRYRQHE